MALCHNTSNRFKGAVHKLYRRYSSKTVNVQFRLIMTKIKEFLHPVHHLSVRSLVCFLPASKLRT